MIRHLRLISGLVLAAFVLLHLINLALGIASLEAMEAMRWLMGYLWFHTPGTVLLATALAVHAGLALYWVYERSVFRLPPSEWLRLLLGFSIPILAAAHIVGVRTTAGVLGSDTSYPLVLAAIFGGGWATVLRQGLLILAVWMHFAIGIHLWLRLRPWYPRAAVGLWPAALMVPVLALIGYARATADVVARLADPGFAASLLGERGAALAAAQAQVAGLEEKLVVGFLGLIAIALLARQVRRAYRNRHGSFTLAYASGERVTVPLGFSILDASRLKGIPHASVCGGRGRCSTCRVKVGIGLVHLPKPSAGEAHILALIQAPADVRLACQTRPRRDVHVTPLLPPTVSAQQALRAGGVSGQEKRVVVLFVDLRESTRLGETNLPYDVVFILNEFFAEMASALRVTGGLYAQFNGDGLMALYGLEGGFEAACRQALRGAADMFRRLDRLNRRFASQLARPLAMGIGIHGGEAIVGTMGPPATPILSAVCDTVNIAARLEAETKRLGRPLVISRRVAAAAGLAFGESSLCEVTLTGRMESIDIVSIEDPLALGLPEALPA